MHTNKMSDNWLQKQCSYITSYIYSIALSAQLLRLLPVVVCNVITLDYCRAMPSIGHFFYLV